ncbi:alpha/beta hydrolase [Larkinella soli]|uniref:alpha/beta hydrolase n=1 Tax=Larkinella soli TaxID=1770527 RepID=UPI000FFBEE38|nr:alpha/beta hydrolase family protein [Larkinella soli]
MRLLCVALLLLPAWFSARAGRVDTVQVESPAMRRAVSCVVISPDRHSASSTDRFPVVYLLHGYGGNHRDWITKVPELTTLADRYGVLIVCPDGRNSWYFDSPLDPAVRYETFMTRELPAFVDARYPTLADRRHRAITGLSMGGHGALYLALRHRDLYGQAASLSGGVDIRPFPNNWEIKKSLGELAAHPENWDRHTVINQTDSLRNGDLRLLIDCGIKDFFFDVNRSLHQKLVGQGIDHDYVERPGAHTWEYWRSNVEYHLLFFSKGFGQ